MNKIIKLYLTCIVLLSTYSIFSSVQEVSSHAELNTMLNRHNTVIIKFHNQACQFCHDHQAQSLVQGIINSFPEVKIIEVDIDKPGNKEIQTKYQVNQLPTYFIIKNGKTHGPVHGNNYYGIENALRAN